MKLSELEREDNLLMAIEDLTTVEEPFFQTVYQGSDGVVAEENVRMLLIFELDDDV